MLSALFKGLAETAKSTLRSVLALTLFFAACWLADAIASGILQGPHR